MTFQFQALNHSTKFLVDSSVVVCCINRQSANSDAKGHLFTEAVEILISVYRETNILQHVEVLCIAYNYSISCEHSHNGTVTSSVVRVFVWTCV